MMSASEQARRYMVAVHGKDWVFTPPEAFPLLDRWMAFVASDKLDEAMAVLDQVEALLAEKKRLGNLPHSRACGIYPHPHGSACSNDCPTCHGLSQLEGRIPANPDLH